MRMNLKDFIFSGGLFMIIILLSWQSTYSVYKCKVLPIELQGISSLFIFFILVIFISIFMARFIHFIFPMKAGIFDLHSASWRVQVWKTLGFLNLFNLSILIHTYLCPVNLRGIVYRLCGAHVGKFSMMGGKIIEPFMVSLGDEVILGEDSLIVGHLITKNKLILGQVIIGNQVTIGVKSIIMPDVIIEDGAVVWAGSLVTRGTRIKKNEEWAGVPAHRISRKSFS